MAQQTWKWLHVRPQRESHQRLIIGYYEIIIFSTDGISTRGKDKDGQKTASRSKSLSHTVVATSEIFVGLQVKAKPNQLWYSVGAHVFEYVIEKNSKVSIPHICHERHEYIRVNFFWPV